MKKDIEEIKEFVEMYKKSDDKGKKDIKILVGILFLPIIMFLFDYFNVATMFFPRIKNLNLNFDWLSFAGAYGGAIVSAILLIFITQNDRAENTKVIRESQRPYLEVSSNILDFEFLNKISDKSIVLEYGEIFDLGSNKKEYLVLEIKNKGQSVAILDVNETMFDLIYTYDEKDIEDIKVTKEKNVEIKLNEMSNRLSLSPGESLIIKFCGFYLYNDRYCLKNSSKITKTEVLYKDLFEKKYVDKCEYTDGNWLPIEDNKII